MSVFDWQRADFILDGGRIVAKVNGALALPDVRYSC